jgi:hemoglobin
LSLNYTFIINISANTNMSKISGDTPYHIIGGEKVVRELVDRFYDLMDEKSEVIVIRKMHAKSLRLSREKLFLFLSGWLGGPDLYVQKYGHPRLRARHLPFEIGESERDQWLMCMNQALDDVVESPLSNRLKESFANIANHMRNQ